MDLPDDLLREAKIMAIKRGVTLRDLMKHALEQELHRGVVSPPERNLLRFPLIPAAGGEFIEISAERIQQIEDEDALRRGGLLR